MSEYKWSAKHISFFPAAMICDYIGAGWDLSDCVDCSAEEFENFNQSNAPLGKALGVGVGGRPCWVDMPPPSKAEQIAQANATKEALRLEAEGKIKPLERAKSLSIATDDELNSLNEWERYSVFLLRVDTSLAPNIEWPQKPQ